VDLELEAHKVGEDRGRPRLCLYRGNSFAWLRPHDGEAMARLGVVCHGSTRVAYGTMLGPTSRISQSQTKRSSLSRQKHISIPFQTDRAQSARVGNIAMYDTSSEVGDWNRILRLEFVTART
jgi:hypothetical protein